jgi:hypothetical protein
MVPRVDPRSVDTGIGEEKAKKGALNSARFQKSKVKSSGAE